MLKEISSCSVGSDGVTRLPFTEEHKRALKIITKWMVDCGLSTRIDDAGTLIGKYNGPKNAQLFWWAHIKIALLMVECLME